MGTRYRRSIRSARFSMGWRARAASSFSPSLYPSIVTYWRLRFIQLLIRHKVRWHFGLGLKHVFSLSLISGPNTRHPARFRCLVCTTSGITGYLVLHHPRERKRLKKKGRIDVQEREEGERERKREGGRRGGGRDRSPKERSAPAWSGGFFLIRRCYGNFIGN